MLAQSPCACSRRTHVRTQTYGYASCPPPTAQRQMDETSKNSVRRQIATRPHPGTPGGAPSQPVSQAVFHLSTKGQGWLQWQSVDEKRSKQVAHARSVRCGGCRWAMGRCNDYRCDTAPGLLPRPSHLTSCSSSSNRVKIDFMRFSRLSAAAEQRHTIQYELHLLYLSRICCTICRSTIYSISL